MCLITYNAKAIPFEFAEGCAVDVTEKLTKLVYYQRN